MEPLIKDCACGQDHMTMPTDVDEIDGEIVEYDLVCIKHKRHEPCRPCMRAEGFVWPHEKRGAL